jgi:hypothetical protein
MNAAQTRARQLNYAIARLYTGKPLVHLTGWYQRRGFVIEREEVLSDRTIVHMIKCLDA